MSRKFKTQRCDCKVNDVVVDCRPAWKQKSKLPRTGRITNVKLQNEFGYALNIRVKWEDDSTETLSPFSSFLYILAPADEVPALQKLAYKRNWRVIRCPGRSQWAYGLITKQNTLVSLEIVEKYNTSIYFEDSFGKLTGFEGKPCLEDSSTTIIAGSKRLGLEVLEGAAQWHTHR